MIEDKKMNVSTKSEIIDLDLSKEEKGDDDSSDLDNVKVNVKLIGGEFEEKIPEPTDAAFLVEDKTNVTKEETDMDFTEVDLELMKPDEEQNNEMQLSEEQIEDVESQEPEEVDFEQQLTYEKPKEVPDLVGGVKRSVNLANTDGNYVATNEFIENYKSIGYHEYLKKLDLMIRKKKRNNLLKKKIDGLKVKKN